MEMRDKETVNFWMDWMGHGGEKITFIKHGKPETVYLYESRKKFIRTIQEMLYEISKLKDKRLEKIFKKYDFSWTRKEGMLQMCIEHPNDIKEDNEWNEKRKKDVYKIEGWVKKTAKGFAKVEKKREAGVKKPE